MRGCLVSLSILVWIGLVASLPARAQDSETEAYREWTSAAGSVVEARLIAFDGAQVQLTTRAGQRFSVPLAQLSSEDRAFLKDRSSQPDQPRVSQIDGVAARPGEISEPIQCAATQWHYRLYLPEDFHVGARWPVWFVMSPSGGDSARPLQRYIQGAERLGCILALSVESRNDSADAYPAALSMVADVFDRIPVCRQLSFATGFSGGGRMSYIVAREVPEIAGILPCGAGGYLPTRKGMDFAEVRDSVAIYSLLGAQCFNRYETVLSHRRQPAHYPIRFFPGGHVWADAELLTDGMTWVMGEALKNYRLPDRSGRIASYTDRVLRRATEAREERPWESFRWAEYLLSLPGNIDRQRTVELGKSVSSLPEVILARQAEIDMMDMVNRHYKERWLPGQSTEVPALQLEAQTFARKYSSIPHGQIFEQLGAPLR